MTDYERNAGVSKTLTEQWKKGELKLGEHYYYTTIFSPTVYIQNFTRDVVSFQDFKETVAEVLAPVPSYEEWLESESHCVVMRELYDIEKEKNSKLKELLESALSWLPDSSKLRGGRYAQLQNLKRKINEVLK